MASAEIFRGAYGWQGGVNDPRKAIYRLTILEHKGSKYEGFSCAIQIQSQNQRYYLMTSCDILPNKCMPTGTTVIADRYCSKWPKHKENHRILLENLAVADVLYIENSICFLPLHQKPQHYLQHHTGLDFHKVREKLECKPNLEMYAFREKKFVQIPFTYAHQDSQYRLDDAEIPCESAKYFLGSPLLTDYEGKNVVVGVVGSEAFGDEDVCPILFSECESASPAKREIIVCSEVQRTKNLNKVNFDGDVDNLVGRYHHGTRMDILTQIQAMLNISNTDHDKNVMVIQGQAGIGKSVLAAIVCKKVKGVGKLAACHFLRQGFRFRNDPKMMFESLASQLCEKIHGFRKQLEERLQRIKEQEVSKMNNRELFEVFLGDPLTSCSTPQNGNCMIVIDALDECEPSQRKELISALFDFRGGLSSLPKWIKILITSRPTRQELPPIPYVKVVTINPEDRENVTDVRNYLQNGLQHIYPNADEKDITLCVSQLAHEADALFLFAYFVLDIAKTKQVELSKIPEIFPNGISSVYEEYFSRLQKELNIEEEKFFAFLEAISAAQGPLPEALILRILGFDETSRTARKLAQLALNHISVLLPVHDGHVTVFHKSVIDWILGRNEVDDDNSLSSKRTGMFQDHSFSVRAKDGHRTLVRNCMELQNNVKACQVFPPPLNDSERYALKFGLKHMMEAGNFEEHLQGFLEDLELQTACLLTMPFKMFLNVIEKIKPKSLPKKDVLFEPLIRSSFIDTPIINLSCDLQALETFAGTEALLTLPTPIQIALNCPVSSDVRREARMLATTTKYKSFTFLEWEPKTWDLPETINSDVELRVSPSGKTAIVWGTNRPEDPLKVTISRVNISEKGSDNAFFFLDSLLPPSDVCLSPDEKNVILATYFGCLEHRSVENLCLKKKIETEVEDFAKSCCFSNCGGKVIVGYGTGTIRIWNFKDACVERMFNRNEGSIARCAVSENGTLLTGAMTKRDAGTIVVWKSIYDNSAIQLSRLWITKYKCVEFSSSGSRIIAVCWKDLEGMDEHLILLGMSYIQVFDANTGNLIYRVVQLFNDVLSLLPINENVVLLSILEFQGRARCLVLLDVSRNQVLSRAVIGQQVYCLTKHGDSSQITALCVQQFSSKLFQSSCDYLFLNLNILNLD